MKRSNSSSKIVFEIKTVEPNIILIEKLKKIGYNMPADEDYKTQSTIKDVK